jgi:hypothetical protein
MIERSLKDAQLAIMARGVWICFQNDPTLEDIHQARRLLDQLTDELIKEKFDVNSQTAT